MKITPYTMLMSRFDDKLLFQISLQHHISSLVFLQKQIYVKQEVSRKSDAKTMLPSFMNRIVIYAISSSIDPYVIIALLTLRFTIRFTFIFHFPR